MVTNMEAKMGDMEIAKSENFSSGRGGDVLN
jgi:hypothetical protein